MFDDLAGRQTNAVFSRYRRILILVWRFNAAVRACGGLWGVRLDTERMKVPASGAGLCEITLEGMDGGW